MIAFMTLGTVLGRNWALGLALREKRPLSQLFLHLSLACLDKLNILNVRFFVSTGAKNLSFFSYLTPCLGWSAVGGTAAEHRGVEDRLIRELALHGKGHVDHEQLALPDGRENETARAFVSFLLRVRGLSW